MIILMFPAVVLLAAIIPIVLAAHALIFFRPSNRPRPATVFSMLGATSTCAAVLVYAFGLLVGLPFLDPEDACRGVGAYSPARSSQWPLSNPICIRDGHRVDLVPAFVNPAIYICIALAIVCTAVAITAFARRDAAGGR